MYTRPLGSLRIKAVMSQERLARRSGVTRDTISGLEAGRRRAYPATVRKLAAGLGVEPQESVANGDARRGPAGRHSRGDGGSGGNTRKKRFGF